MSSFLKGYTLRFKNSPCPDQPESKKSLMLFRFKNYTLHFKGSQHPDQPESKYFLIFIVYLSVAGTCSVISNSRRMSSLFFLSINGVRPYLHTSAYTVSVYRCFPGHSLAEPFPCSCLPAFGRSAGLVPVPFP